MQEEQEIWMLDVTQAFSPLSHCGSLNSSVSHAIKYNEYNTMHIGKSPSSISKGYVYRKGWGGGREGLQGVLL